MSERRKFGRIEAFNLSAFILYVGCLIILACILYMMRVHSTALAFMPFLIGYAMAFAGGVLFGVVVGPAGIEEKRRRDASKS